MNAGIVGYGAYIPRLRIKVETIAAVWGKDGSAIRAGLKIDEKAVPNHDEDTATISVHAALNALRRAKIDPKEIGAIYVGSESHPYAVKPTSTIVGEAIGVSNSYTAADLEFACKAGTAGMQIAMGLAASGMIKYGLAIGADTAQGAPGNALEYSAAGGGAAYIIGAKKDEMIAQFDETYSFSSDTPDFWRRNHARYPSHGGRFTGGPAYFRHVEGATNGILEKMGAKVDDFDHVVFHMPNGKFPLNMAQKYGIPKEKIANGFVVQKIGNTYSGCTPLGLSAILDVAKPGERILATSYGSGSGSDSFALTVTDLIDERRDLAKTTKMYIDNKKYIDYPTYAKFRGKIR
ncbi:MAG: hydroxymethylglutaryl-CoA synthase [archaeon]